MQELTGGNSEKTFALLQWTHSPMDTLFFKYLFTKDRFTERFAWPQIFVSEKKGSHYIPLNRFRRVECTNSPQRPAGRSRSPPIPSTFHLHLQLSFHRLTFNSVSGISGWRGQYLDKMCKMCSFWRSDQKMPTRKSNSIWGQLDVMTKKFQSSSNIKTKSVVHVISNTIMQNKYSA